MRSNCEPERKRGGQLPPAFVAHEGGKEKKRARGGNMEADDPSGERETNAPENWGTTPSERREIGKHRGGKVEHRARGGRMEHETEEERKKREEEQHRRRGGRVHGAKPKERPDRRARGGATSDANPLTSAGKMSMPSYESGNAKNSPNSGAGADRD